MAHKDAIKAKKNIFNLKKQTSGGKSGGGGGGKSGGIKGGGPDSQLPPLQIDSVIFRASFGSPIYEKGRLTIIFGGGEGKIGEGSGNGGVVKDGKIGLGLFGHQGEINWGVHGRFPMQNTGGGCNE